MVVEEKEKKERRNKGGWFVVDLDDQLSREGRGSERMSKRGVERKRELVMLA